MESHLNFSPDNRRELEPDFFFMMNCLLYSRMETGFPSNHDFYDEDVNVYIANLLCAFMNPDYHRRAKKYLSRYDTTLFKKIQDSSDVRLKYTIYKTNADFLLISIGIFRNPDGQPARPELGLHHSEQAHMGKGKAYYQFAYTYSQSMYRKATAVSEVLEKLSRGFEQYVEILSHMRGEYFNILEKLGEGDVYHLERSIDKHQTSEQLKVLQDQFLDVYSEYTRTKDPALRTRLEEIVKAIQELDETFYFKIDD